MFRHGCTTINFNWILIRQLILITSKHNQKRLSLPFSVDLNGTSIHLSSSVRNLGVISFQQHVSRTCQICCFELRRINSIHHYLSQDAVKTLIPAFVLSRIEYCNSPLAYCPKQLIHKVQKDQNKVQGSSVELLSLITYLPSFTRFTGFLLNKELNTNCFSLPLNL